MKVACTRASSTSCASAAASAPSCSAKEVRARSELTINNFLGGLRKLRLRVARRTSCFRRSRTCSSSGVGRRERRAAHAARHLRQQRLGPRPGRLRPRHRRGLSVRTARAPRSGIDRPFFRDRVLAGGSWNLQCLDLLQRQRGRLQRRERRVLRLPEPVPARPTSRSSSRSTCAIARSTRRYGGLPLILHAEQGSPAIGGAFSYVKVVPDLRLYAPLGRRVVFAVRGLLGWLQPMRRRARAPSRVASRWAAPRATAGSASGAWRRRSRLAGPTASPSAATEPCCSRANSVSTSHKIGGAWLGRRAVRRRGQRDRAVCAADPTRTLNVAVGLSLEYTTPIGVVRGGVGVRVNRLDGDVPGSGQRFAYHITIGEAF